MTGFELLRVTATVTVLGAVIWSSLGHTPQPASKAPQMAAGFPSGASDAVLALEPGSIDVQKVRSDVGRLLILQGLCLEGKLGRKPGADTQALCAEAEALAAELAQTEGMVQ